MSHRIPSLLLLVLTLLTASSRAWACGGTIEKDMGYGGVAKPLSKIDHLNKPTVLPWHPRGDLPAGAVGFIKLGVVANGDRLEAAPDGESDVAKWWVTPIPDQHYDGGTGLNVRVVGKRVGETQISLRYVARDGETQDVQLRVTVNPPEPPPPPPTLTVEGETFKGRVYDYRTFQIRLKMPLAPGHRWEVKEAVYHDRTTRDGEQWLPVGVHAQGEEGLFLASAQGDFARIVFIQKRDGWQLFPDTVTLLLEVAPTPKC
jgi:hypothetical protein